MIRRLFTQCQLRPGDVPPSRADMEVVGTFNPGAIEFEGEIVLLVRVAERPKERRPGWTPLPRYEPGGGIVIDQVPDEHLVPIDPRIVRRKSDGCVRITSVSHLRVMRSGDGRRIDSMDGPCFLPEADYEMFGVEDPRITRIDDRYYLTYVAVSPHGAATALASTRDFRQFDRHGIIFCPENKDVLLFPEKIGGRYAALHRPNPATHFSHPEMWLAYSDDLVSWGAHAPLLGGGSTWDAGRIGGGCPPVRTQRGWLEIYHGNDKAGEDGDVGRYFGAAFMMDGDDPSRIVAQSDGPIMAPEADFETEGFVPNVVFPTAMIERGDKFLIYYGAADASTGVVGLARDELLAALQ